jgi:alpha 1,2-mannosyltransferase
LSFSHEGYGQATSLSKIKEQLVGAGHNPPYKTPVPEHYYQHTNTSSPHGERKANAVIVMLARNGDLAGVLKSMKQMEDRFNKKFRYPYVFLNEEPFTDKFKQYIQP